MRYGLFCDDAVRQDVEKRSLNNASLELRAGRRFLSTAPSKVERPSKRPFPCADLVCMDPRRPQGRRMTAGRSRPGSEVRWSLGSGSVPLAAGQRSRSGQDRDSTSRATAPVIWAPIPPLGTDAGVGLFALSCACRRTAVPLSLQPMLGWLVRVVALLMVAASCAHSASSRPPEQQSGARAESNIPDWRAAVAAHLALCRSAPMCRSVSSEKPCACDGETFPCKEFDFDDGPGCQLRLSCIRVASGDDTAPPDEAPVLCGAFGEQWRARERAEYELQCRLSVTTARPLGPDSWPISCPQAVDYIFARLDNELRSIIRGMKRKEMILFHLGWGQSIRNNLGMWRGNDRLVRSCSKEADDGPEQASAHLLEMVWDRAQAAP